MSLHFPVTLYQKYIVVFLICVWLFTCFNTCQATSHKDILCVEREREALLHFKHGISVDSCGLLDSWGGSQDCCTWSGIHCNNHSGLVTGLTLTGNNGPSSLGCLQGTLSASLVELKHLKYLDLSFNYFSGSIPKSIGSLANLETLNLGFNGFDSIIPPEIGNLSRLTSLDLSVGFVLGRYTLNVRSLSWLSQLRLLRKLHLDYVNMSLATNWLSIVNNLPFLESLSLGGCSLSLKLPSSLTYINSSTSLREISLDDNNLNDTSIFEWLFNLTGLDTTLVSLALSINHQMFGSNLEITQRVMKFLGNLCSLRFLLLSETNLNYDFSDIVHALSACAHNSLEYLDLSSNQIWGSIPDGIGTFSSLRQLQLNYNQLNGTLSPALGQLFMLVELDLRSNSLTGVVTTSLLSNLTELSGLYLSYNKELVVNIRHDWNPPFQLQLLYLGSCKIGPRFPNWLITQKSLGFLDISNAGISDSISVALTKSLFLPELMFLNMSHNMIYGVLPDIPSIVFEHFPEIDLSYNNLEGSIPLFLRNNNVSDLRLNSNKLSQGLVPLLCPKTKMQLTYLDLSNNLFSAKLPDCWSFFYQLSVLNLENNSLWGNLPTSIGTLGQLQFLHLRNNNLSGELPTSLVNCTSLVTLDLAYNSLTGYIPRAFGRSFKNLGILTLRRNHFFGDLPSSLCHLSELQILDVSRNHISGIIPRCVYELKGMANSDDRLQNISVIYGQIEGEGATFDSEWIMWKRQERSFKGGLSLGLLGIDMSGNKLEGHIPGEISSLMGLIFLNLSGNSLSGAIPSKIGQLALLEYLDLSHNNLSGQIPASLAQIDTLGTLDVSYNHLSGMIPVGTQLQGFNDSSFVGNPELCGAPLPKCRGDESPPIPQNRDNTTQHDEHNIAEDIYPGLYISVVLGFIVGFWGVCGTLIIKRSWRLAFFRFYDDTKDKVYVMLVTSTARAWRRS